MFCDLEEVTQEKDALTTHGQGCSCEPGTQKRMTPLYSDKIVAES